MPINNYIYQVLAKPHIVFVERFISTNNILKSSDCQSLFVELGNGFLIANFDMLLLTSLWLNILSC